MESPTINTYIHDPMLRGTPLATETEALLPPHTGGTLRIVDGGNITGFLCSLQHVFVADYDSDPRRAYPIIDLTVSGEHYITARGVAISPILAELEYMEYGPYERLEDVPGLKKVGASLIEVSIEDGTKVRVATGMLTSRVRYIDTDGIKKALQLPPGAGVVLEVGKMTRDKDGNERVEWMPLFVPAAQVVEKVTGLE